VLPDADKCSISAAVSKKKLIETVHARGSKDDLTGCQGEINVVLDLHWTESGL